MFWNQQFVFIAVKPLRAEHPVGSGQIVNYAPGDVVPAADWGRAAGNLVESGKIIRTAMNVPVDQSDPLGGGGEGAPALAAAVSALPESSDDAPVTEVFPQSVGRGFFLLSDGTRVRGAKIAAATQAELDAAAASEVATEETPAVEAPAEDAPADEATDFEAPAEDAAAESEPDVANETTGS